jgi:DNA primase
MPAISRLSIDRIRETADIVEVVSDFVPLKKRGKDWVACCPFHSEKSPSFHVNPSRGFYKCFGCGKGGDAISFVMEIEKAGYVEALRWLAGKYHITIEEDNAAQPTDAQELAYSERESLAIVMKFASQYFFEQLLQSEDGKALGLSYFKERGFNTHTLETFNLGYSHNTWDGLMKVALAAGHNLALLEKAGLLIRKEDNKVFDRFRGRVMFPIHSAAGKVIGFGARLIGSDKTQPKYLNSPETPLYHKSDVLYGLFQAKQFIRTTDNCYLCEGYTDVISLHQGGVKNVVASSGTALTDNQIKLIARYTRNITVLYDGDAAGIKASIRGIDMILEAGLNVRAVSFPEGHDPDSYLNKVGTAAFTEYLQSNSLDFIAFKARLFAEEAANDPFRKAALIKEMVESIIKIPDPLTRMVFFTQCAEVFQVPEDMLIAEGNKIRIISDRKSAQKLVGNNQVFPDDFSGPVPEPLDLPFSEEIGGPLPELNNLAYPEDLAWATQVSQQQTGPQHLAEKTLAIQEKACLRLLLNYADISVKEEVIIATYYLQELQDLHFHNQVYNQMLQEFKGFIEQGSLPTPDYFTLHQNEKIREVSLEMFMERNTLSENWFTKHQIFIPEEKSIVHQLAFKNVLGIKLSVLKKRTAEAMQYLRQAPPEEIEHSLKTIRQLKEAEKTIAQLLGNTIG